MLLRMEQTTAKATRQEPGLRAALRAQGRKQFWLAQQLQGVSEDRMSEWVRGEVPIPPERIREIARVLRVPQRDIR